MYTHTDIGVNAKLFCRFLMCNINLPLWGSRYISIKKFVKQQKTV